MSWEMEFGLEGVNEEPGKEVYLKDCGMEGTCHGCHIYEISSSKDVGEM